MKAKSNVGVEQPKTVTRSVTTKTATPKQAEPESPGSIRGAGPVPVDPLLRHEYVSTAAYFRAERRGFAGNRELEDWFAAEAEINDVVH